MLVVKFRNAENHRLCQPDRMCLFDCQISTSVLDLGQLVVTVAAQTRLVHSHANVLPDTSCLTMDVTAEVL